MSVFRRTRELTGDVAAASKRRALRTKLEIEVRRLESRASGEKDAIGHALFPALEAGTVRVEGLGVQQHLDAIATLLAKIAQCRAEIEVLAQPSSDEAAKAVDASIADTDRNATSEASADQSAADDRAARNDSPAEQGGQG